MKNPIKTMNSLHVSIEGELLKLNPETKQLKLGSHCVFRYETATPAHSFVSILKVTDSGAAIELTARDSFSESLAIYLLDQTNKNDPVDHISDCIRVRRAKFPNPWSFNEIVVVPPLIAKRFEHQSAVLSGITFWVVPVFSGEFKDGDSGKTFWHQLGRKDGWRLHVINWNRKIKTQPTWD